LADLPTRSFNTIVQTIAAGIQGRAAALIDLSVGSPLRAIAEAVAGVALWLQAFALQILTVARLATSVGTDVDSFVADFELTRLSESLATGTLTFTRYTAAATSPFVPVGATVQTSDGSQTVTVVADTTNANFSSTLNGYSMPTGATTLTVTAQAQSAGPSGNILAGTAIVPTTPLVGIDQVSNSLAFVGGALAETDNALKARFVLFILGLSRGNIYGVEYALASLNVSIAYTITDQYTYSGVFTPGFFYVVVDDGSGTPSSAFLTAATNAVNSVRPLGVNFSVFAPDLVSANVGMILTTASGYNHTAVVNQVLALLSANIIALGLGAGLPYSRLAAWAYSVPGVTNASAITLNSGTADIAANNQDRIMPGTITVS
jgi:uncharacterized phage protein gp47/JayE